MLLEKDDLLEKKKVDKKYTDLQNEDVRSWSLNADKIKKKTIA